MPTLLEKIQNKLAEFPKGTGEISIKKEIPMQEIRRQSNAKEQWVWAESSGVYYFRNDSEILYIGRATKFGKRIAEHISEPDREWSRAEEWKRDIADSTAAVGLISIKKENERLIEELEKYLIRNLEVKYNIQYNR